MKFLFESLKIGEIGSVVFIIAPIVRHNLYKTPQIFNEWGHLQAQLLASNQSLMRLMPALTNLLLNSGKELKKLKWR